MKFGDFIELVLGVFLVYKKYYYEVVLLVSKVVVVLGVLVEFCIFDDFYYICGYVCVDGVYMMVINVKVDGDFNGGCVIFVDMVCVDLIMIIMWFENYFVFIGFVMVSS